MQPEILAEVLRGDTVESIHRGHFVVLDGGGNTIASVGDPETVTFLRSSAKPFQALPLITSGAADAFGLTDDEIALATASHSGERMHIEVAERMLAKIGLFESDLRCGTHSPFYEPESERMIRNDEHPTQLHNNCSGKHIAMLALARHTGTDIRSYENLDHPIQQTILETVSILTEVPIDELKIAIDGCAAPNFAMPVSAMAKSIVSLIAPPEIFSENLQKACRRIVSAMIEFPELIGGTGRLDTMLMQAAPGKLISKVGADGVWLCGVLPDEKWPKGLGIALKIEDGDDRRARPVVAVEILRQLGILSRNDLSEISPMPIKNRRGDVVGKVESANASYQMT